MVKDDEIEVETRKIELRFLLREQSCYQKLLTIPEKRPNQIKKTGQKNRPRPVFSKTENRPDNRAGFFYPVHPYCIGHIGMDIRPPSDVHQMFSIRG